MAFTDFYFQANGAHINAGSDTNAAAKFTSVNGNWSTTTNIFTPTDGTNPVSAGVAVGDWASIYIDGATAAVCSCRITAVVNAANGTITVHGTAFVGAKPATSATARSIKVGGAMIGPNGAGSIYPLNLSWSNATNAAGNRTRLNFKNDQVYTQTVAATEGGGNSSVVLQGYSSTPGDGGKATIDFGTLTGTLYTGGQCQAYIDFIFKSSATSGTGALFTTPSVNPKVIRCVFTGSQGPGVSCSGSGTYVECEIYGCHKNNAASAGAWSGSGNLIRCYIHDNGPGTGAHGVYLNSVSQVQNCVLESNTGCGIMIGSSNVAATITGCDCYNNTLDGIQVNAAPGGGHYIENCNLVKNGGAGISNPGAPHGTGYIYNCGYGSGTQANGSADTIGDYVQVGTVTYPANLTPWVDPVHGDFRVNLPAANWAGRGSFTETDVNLTAPNTIGYPDIGSAQSQTGPSGTFSKEVSYGFNG